MRWDGGLADFRRCSGDGGCGFCVFFDICVLFLRFSEVFRVWALLFQKSALFWWKKNAGGHCAHKSRAFGHKSVFFTQKALFWGGKNRRRPLRTQVQGFWSQKVSSLLKKGQQKLNSSKTNIGGNSPRCTDASVSSSGYDTFNFPMKRNYEVSKYAKNFKKYKKQPKSPLGPGGISKKGQQKLNL